MRQGVSPVPVQMYQGASPVPAQMWQGRAHSRCRCGRGEPSPGADVAGSEPSVSTHCRRFSSPPPTTIARRLERMRFACCRAAV
jgi:hypothetical protein